MVETLYELAQKALDEAFRLRCESLLEDVYENIPTPMDQNGDFQIVKKLKKYCPENNISTKRHTCKTDAFFGGS
jgi:hypothetical protein